jgi:hypothetical protein
MPAQQRGSQYCLMAASRQVVRSNSRQLRPAHLGTVEIWVLFSALPVYSLEHALCLAFSTAGKRLAVDAASAEYLNCGETGDDLSCPYPRKVDARFTPILLVASAQEHRLRDTPYLLSL